MDNLLENQLFIDYMTTKYKKDLTNRIKKIITGEDVVWIRTSLLSNIIDFSEKNGRGYVSIVDNSCSVISGDNPYTSAQVAEYSRILDQLGPTVAKGKTKRKKTKRKKTKRKKTKRKKTKRKKTKRYT
jgi:dissimilatory sulfite reductase (desulfoviridin) alpha/beta subunit